MSAVEHILRDVFHLDTFREGQKEVIDNVLAHQDVLAVLPTGTGKSLCYELPSLLLPGHTLIVSPLLSLMDDQVSRLKQRDKSVVALNSLLDYDSRRYILSHLSEYKYIFISPETMAQKGIRQKLKQLPVSLLVVDEAHCISQWGFDFRPDYLQLKELKQELDNPVTLALTATATERVRQDIGEQLFGGNGFHLVQKSVNRPNIAYAVTKTDDKIAFITQFLEAHPVPGIIYFTSRKMTEQVSEKVRQLTNRRAAYYHGGLSSQERTKIQQQFLAGQLDVLCATSAFGMGVDKSDIRFVIHYHLPDSLESYLQESGRAGRDGGQSLSVILYNQGDEMIHRRMMQDSYQEKKALLFLREKSAEQKQGYNDVLTDVQRKWLKQLTADQLDWTTFERTAELKQLESRLQLDSVLNYVHSSGCRRQELLTYFDEGELAKASAFYCCDNCGLPQKVIASEPFKETNRGDIEKNWKIILKMLFFNDF